MRAEQLLDESATRFAKKAAVVAAGREHSYAELQRSSDRVAAALLRHGVAAGDRIALFLDDTFEAVVSTFAVLKAGGVATPIDTSSDAGTVAGVLARSGAVAVITEARLASIAGAAMAGTSSVRLVVLAGGDRTTASESCLVFEALTGGIGAGPHFGPAGPESAPALLLPAPGDMGGPSASTMTHAEYVAAAAATSISDDGRAFASLLSVAGLCLLLAVVRAGATLVLAPTARAIGGRGGDSALALAG